MSHDHPTSSDQRVNQSKYAAGYLRVFGKPCPECNGTGKQGTDVDTQYPCHACNGVGYEPKKRKT